MNGEPAERDWNTRQHWLDPSVELWCEVIAQAVRDAGKGRPSRERELARWFLANEGGELAASRELILAVISIDSSWWRRAIVPALRDQWSAADVQGVDSVRSERARAIWASRRAVESKAAQAASVATGNV